MRHDILVDVAFLDQVIQGLVPAGVMRIGEGLGSDDRLAQVVGRIQALDAQVGKPPGAAIAILVADLPTG